jgi:hypothetical protein
MYNDLPEEDLITTLSDEELVQEILNAEELVFRGMYNPSLYSALVIEEQARNVRG